MIFAARKIQQRKDAGMQTKVRIRGEVLTEVKLEYYFKRRPLSTIEQNELLVEEPTTPSDLEYGSPRSVSPDGLEDEKFEPEEDVETVSKTDDTPQLALVTIPRHEVEDKTPPTSQVPEKDDFELDLSSFMADAFKPQDGMFSLNLSPQEEFVARLYEHVRLRNSGETFSLQKRERFDTTGILRAAGWFDEHLQFAVKAEQQNNQTLARHIINRCADIVAGEVNGYFPDTVIFEMVEIVHYLQLRNASALQLSFMYSLYDKVSSKLGQFHPLVELLCAMTKGYTTTLSASLIPTTLDFLDQTPGSASLSILLPLFAFQGLRTIDTMPRELILHTTRWADTRCDRCQAAFENSPFTSQPFRSWAARQFLNFLNDIWVEPVTDQNSAWHSMMRSRVWRYTWKYPSMTEKREALQNMTFKQRFWAVAKLCLELVTRMIEVVFLECHNFFSPSEHIHNIITESRRTGLKEDEIRPLWRTEEEISLFDMDIIAMKRSNPQVGEQIKRSVRYWVGEDLCCIK